MNKQKPAKFSPEIDSIGRFTSNGRFVNRPYGRLENHCGAVSCDDFACKRSNSHRPMAKNAGRFSSLQAVSQINVAAFFISATKAKGEIRRANFSPNHSLVYINRKCFVSVNFDLKTDNQTLRNSPFEIRNEIISC